MERTRDINMSAPLLTCGPLNIQVSALTGYQVREWAITANLETSEPTIVAGHNLHSAYLYNTVESFRAFYRSANIVLADGFPIVIAAKLFGGSSAAAVQRIGSTDWLPHLTANPRLHRLAIVGATRESNARYSSLLRRDREDLSVMSIPGADWSTERERSTIEKLRAFAPQVVIVGLGMPLQERFLHSNRESLPGAYYLAVGGAIDQLSGHQRNAPRWLGKVGLEWAWRLATQPRRLFYRYCVEPWRLVGLVVWRGLRGRS